VSFSFCFNLLSTMNCTVFSVKTGKNPKSIADIINDYGFESRKVYEWYEQATRLIAVSAGGLSLIIQMFLYIFKHSQAPSIFC